MTNHQNTTAKMPEEIVPTLTAPQRLWRCFRPLLMGTVIGGLMYWGARQFMESHEGIAIFLYLLCGGGPMIGLMVTCVALLLHWEKLLESAARTPNSRITYGILFAIAAVGLFLLSTWLFTLGDKEGEFLLLGIILAIIAVLPALGLALSALALLWKPHSPWREEVALATAPAPLVHRGNPSRSMTRGWMMHLLGILILVVGVLLSCFSWKWMFELQWPAFIRFLLLIVVAFGSYYSGVGLIASARRLRARCAKSIMEEDPRPPILFLRSFTEDGADAVAHGIVTNRMKGRPGILFLFEVWRILRGKESMTFEEELASWFGKYGPFVAIGKPGEELATLGASRLYVDHNSWKEKVSELVSNARWVVWQAGQTPGTWWELEKLLLHVAPTKVLLIAPHDLRPETGDEFWDKDMTGIEPSLRDHSIRKQFMARANQLLPRPLPEMSCDDRIILFDDQWNPSAYPLVIRSWLGQQIHDSVIDLNATFQIFVTREKSSS